MGKCFHCEKEIKIKNGEKGCPNCGKNPYFCWNCKTEIWGNEIECHLPNCGFFVCSNCGSCGNECIIERLVEEVEGKTIKEIIRYIFDYKSGGIRRNCPEGVPISYAREKNRFMALKMKGFGVYKKQKDAYVERFQKLWDYPIGKSWVIEDIKEDGFHGVECREVSNLMVCIGGAKKEVHKRKDGTPFDVWIRIDSGMCEYQNWEKVVKKQCPKCKKDFPEEQEQCTECTYTKGDKKGFPYQLKERKSDCSFCNLPLNEFIKVGDDIEEEGNDS